MLDAKLLKPLSCMPSVNNNSFAGPLIIGTFEKRAPEHQTLLSFTFFCHKP